MPKFYKLDYRLLNPLGEEVDSSAGGNPMAFVEGDGTMVPGLEAAVLGKLAGDEFEVKISRYRKLYFRFLFTLESDLKFAKGAKID